jgi:putative transposase
MATRKTAFVKGEYYHIYNRGNSKQVIFLDEEDYEHFVHCLFVCNTKRLFKFRDDIVLQNIDTFDFDREQPIVSIGAWVLMPNHFHIYLTINPHTSDMWNKNEITEFLRKLSTAYVKYFNAKYSRTGGLFEGAFKATHVETDTQARYLFSYLHLNPVKLVDTTWKETGIKNIAHALNFLKNYKWSSYLDYKGTLRPEGKIITPNDFPPYFENIINFDKQILIWLNQK